MNKQINRDGIAIPAEEFHLISVEGLRETEYHH